MAPGALHKACPYSCTEWGGGGSYKVDTDSDASHFVLITDSSVAVITLSAVD